MKGGADGAVMSRPGSNAWGVVGVFGVMAVVVAVITYEGRGDLAGLWLGGAISVLALCVALSAAAYAAFTSVRADNDGLHWCGLLHGRRSAPWHAVTDFYLQASRLNASSAVIETRAGRIALAHDSRDLEALKEAVACHVTNAKVHQWKLLGTRPGDAPLTFSYDAIGTRVSAPLSAVLLVALIGAIAWASARYWENHATGAGPAPGALLIPIALFTALGAAYGCRIVSIMTAARRADHRRRCGERIVVTSRGIRYEDRDRVVEAAWPDVTGYGVRGVRAAILTLPVFTVSTRTGEFDFLPTLVNRWVLMACIKQEAAHADGSWLQRLDGTPLTRNARPDPRAEGGRVYHYRTRTNRAVLFLAVFLIFATVITVGRDAGPWSLGLSVPLAVLLLSWLAWRYTSAAIRTDEAGVTQYAPFHTRFIPWSALAAARLHASDEALIEALRGNGETIRFWETIAEVDDLRAEIQRRITAG
jgi:hypothetical protein